MFLLRLPLEAKKFDQLQIQLQIIRQHPCEHSNPSRSNSRAISDKVGVIVQLEVAQLTRY